jgi:hypothetical protein
MAVKFAEPTKEDVKEDLVAVRLIRGYVPMTAEPDANGVYTKILPGKVVSLPREEARRALKEKIAEIAADMI